MKWDIETRLRFLRIAYTIASGVLLLLVAVIPLVVTRKVPLTRSLVIEEETAEVLAIVLLLVLAAAGSRLYRKELRRYSLKIQTATRLRERLEERLADAFGYIGAVNVEIGEILPVLCRVEQYPQSRKQFQEHLDDLTRRAMVIAAADWGVVRIADIRNLRTLKEARQSRAGTRCAAGLISNRALIEDRRLDGHTVVGTRAKNLPFRTFLVFPAPQLQTRDRILLSAIAGEIEMLFLIYASGFVSQFQTTETSRSS